MVENNQTLRNNNKESFAEHLQKVRKCLVDKRLLGELADRSGAKPRTVQYALSAKYFSELRGMKLTVYREALKMKEELEALTENFEDCSTHEK